MPSHPRKWKVAGEEFGSTLPCRRDPELLMVPCKDVASALLHLKVALPTLDILELVRRRPSLLREKVCGAFHSSPAFEAACAGHT